MPDDFGIPLLLRCTVTEIVGRGRLEGVVRSGRTGPPVPETERQVDCDTLLLSVGSFRKRGAQAGIARTRDQWAVTDPFLQTSVPGLAAATAGG
ncbi:MAG: FAD-dependent oxidoreductase [Evtepia gabavorous]